MSSMSEPCRERWVRIGLDDDGEVFVTRDIDEEHMRIVRFGDGTEERFRPDAPHLPWLDSLTHWDTALYPAFPEASR